MYELFQQETRIHNLTLDQFYSNEMYAGWNVIAAASQEKCSLMWRSKRASNFRLCKIISKNCADALYSKPFCSFLIAPISICVCTVGSSFFFPSPICAIYVLITNGGDVFWTVNRPSTLQISRSLVMMVTMIIETINVCTHKKKEDKIKRTHKLIWIHCSRMSALAIYFGLDVLWHAFIELSCVAALFFSLSRWLIKWFIVVAAMKTKFSVHIWWH